MKNSNDTQNLLYIHMDFYYYDDEIINEIGKLGYNVIPFHDKLQKNLYSRILKRMSKKSRVAEKKSEKYQIQFFEDLKKKEISIHYCFIIVGRYLSTKFMKRLSDEFPDMKVIVYLWDDVDRIENFENLKTYYNKIFTMDMDDSKNYGYEFLPLFYIEQFRYSKSIIKDLSLFSSGLDHSNRVEIISEIIDNYEYFTDTYFHIYSGRFTRFVSRLKKLDFKRRRNYIHYHKLPMIENINLTLRARYILDIQYESQNGLTIRTFESLAAKAKLITTNESIKEYDFYRPQNILVIDREDIVIPEEFLNDNYQEIPENIIEKYSLGNWIRRIFECRY